MIYIDFTYSLPNEKLKEKYKWVIIKNDGEIVIAKQVKNNKVVFYEEYEEYWNSIRYSNIKQNVKFNDKI